MEQSRNKLGTMPIGKLLAVMSVPMMVSMFIQALYNVVDSMFVAKISEEALAAVSLAYLLHDRRVKTVPILGISRPERLTEAMGVFSLGEAALHALFAENEP